LLRTSSSPFAGANQTARRQQKKKEARNKKKCLSPDEGNNNKKQNCSSALSAASTSQKGMCCLEICMNIIQQIHPEKFGLGLPPPQVDLNCLQIEG